MAARRPSGRAVSCPFGLEHAEHSPVAVPTRCPHLALLSAGFARNTSPWRRPLSETQLAQERENCVFYLLLYLIFSALEGRGRGLEGFSPLPFSQISFLSSQITTHLLGAGFTFLGGHLEGAP